MKGTGRIHLVVNPAANHGKSGATEAVIRGFLESRGATVEWRETAGTGDARRITRGLPEDEVVVAVGGDGTVHEVAAACAGTGRVMGVLPTGSGNDYIKALGGNTKLTDALKVVVGGNVRTVDTAEVNGVTFNNGLGIGFDAEVAAGVKAAPAFLGGAGRYLWSVGRLLWNFECHEARLTLDGERQIEAKTILVAAALGTTYGARFRLAPDSKLDDGLFDVVWSEEISRADVLRIIPSAFRDGLHSHKEVNLARCRHLKVELQEPVPAHVDGEMLPPTTTFEARVLPGSLRVLAPGGNSESGYDKARKQ